MLQHILRASAVNAPIPTVSENIDVEFWDKYYMKLDKCHSDKNKCAQLLSNLHDTVSRICDSSVPVESSSTTRWERLDVLYFNPVNLDVNRIAAEQRASMFVMHEPSTYSRIHAVLDLSKITIWTALYITSKASYNNVVDGLRLWSTLPYSIERIYVIRPSDHKFKWMYDFIVPKLLSKKLQARVCVCESLKQAMNLVNEGPISFDDTCDRVCTVDSCDGYSCRMDKRMR